MLRIKNYGLFYRSFMQNGSCQFIYTANYLAELKLFHEGSRILDHSPQLHSRICSWEF